MASIPGKLNLKSTSKIPLSDRFKMVRQKALLKRNLTPTNGSSNTSGTPRVSRKNRALAAQMASKPSVLAALRLKKRSIKQRLGGKVKAVKGLSVGRKGLRANKLDLSSRLQPKPSLAAKRVRLNRNFGGGKVNPSNTGRIRNNNKPKKMNTTNSTAPRRFSNKRGRVRSDNFGNQRLRNTNSNREDTFRPRSRGRGRGRGRRGDGRSDYQYDYTPSRGGGGGGAGPARRGNRGGFRGGRGRGRGGRGSNQGNSQENNRFRQSKQRFQNRWAKRRANLDRGTLDKDLDAYMSKTRGQLDADLDAYMSGV
ncbi:uncharacterized protein LOC141849597 [Brevipalpus obovatus]|uniref:uncharacterized protein LOC141849597 n=1 Tax=Brevipalpus obovatus TaxID=246614 RepID=UPI003D9F01FF